MKPQPNFYIFLRRFWSLFILAFAGLLLTVWIAFFIQNERSYPKANIEIGKLLLEIKKVEEGNTDSTRSMALKIIDLAERSNHSLALAQGYYWLAKTNLVENKYSENTTITISYARISWQSLNQSNNHFWEARILNLMASAFSVQGEIDSAIHYNKRGYEKLSLLKNAKKDSLYELADLLRVEAHIKYLEDRKKNNGVSSIEGLKINQELLKESLLISRQIDDLEGEGICLRNLGYDYRENGDYENAIIFLNQALQVNQKMVSEIAQQNTLRELGKSYIHQLKQNGTEELLTLGLDYYRQALHLKGGGKTNTLLHIGLAYHNALFYVKGLSEEIYGQYLDSCNHFYGQALNSAKRENNLKLLSKIVSNYSGICEELGPNNGCKGLVKKSNTIYKEILLSTNDIHGQGEQISRVFEHKMYQKKIYKQNLRLILMGVILFIVISGFLIFYENLRLSFLRRQLFSQLTALQAQMNPHFISNSLNSIESLINLNENRKASEYLVKFSHLARMVLHHSQEELIPLESEVKMLRYYLELEKLRMGSKLEFSIQLDKKINPSVMSIPPMMLQPLVENAVWHGIKPKEGDGKVTIQFQMDAEDLMICTIEDNGVGREKSKQLQQESAFPQISHSTRIIEERIEILKRGINLTQEIQMRITDLKDDNENAVGTKVEVFIYLT